MELIHQFLNTTYWAKTRTLKEVKTTIDNSLCFGIYDGKTQLGFARVVTDYAVFAWILDVFILPEHRKKGLSKKLMDTIMSHPDLQSLKRWGLNTLDAHTLYEKYGFKRVENSASYMEIVNLAYSV